jgi:hypothetical protein
MKSALVASCEQRDRCVCACQAICRSTFAREIVSPSSSAFGCLQLLPDMVSEPCTVCLQNLRDGTELMSLPCAHTFHTYCITENAAANGKHFHDVPCPQCKLVPSEVAGEPAADAQARPEVPIAVSPLSLPILTLITCQIRYLRHLGPFPSSSPQNSVQNELSDTSRASVWTCFMAEPFVA